MGHLRHPLTSPITTKRLQKRNMPIHPLVRDLYKQALLAGRDYPTGIHHVRERWKKAILNAENCPSCYDSNNDQQNRTMTIERQQQCEKEIRLAVARGRHMLREMMGVIQLKKYRAMRHRYD
jgi:hypothetical protein